jgi:hypothetical protein
MCTIISVEGFEREVEVLRKGNVFVGYVGNHLFLWDKDKYPDGPKILIDKWNRKYYSKICNFHGQPYNYNNRNIYPIRKMVAAYLSAYAVALRSNNKSPMHFNHMTEEEKELARERAQFRKRISNYISGVPVWLREKKVWSLCKWPNRDDKFYERRTTWAEEDWDLVEEWLPICSKCDKRNDEVNPCPGQCTSKTPIKYNI